MDVFEAYSNEVLELPSYERFSLLRRRPKRLPDAELPDITSYFSESVEEKQETPTFPAVKRHVSEHDATRIGTLVTEALSQLDEQGLTNLEVVTRPGITLATKLELEQLFRGSCPTVSPRQLRRFGFAIVQEKERMNADSSQRFAKFGSIGISGRGPLPDRPEGRWFVSAVIDDGTDELIDERQSFIKSITSVEGSKLADQLNRGYKNVGLLKTSCRASAERAFAALRVTELSSIWVTLEEVSIIPNSFEPTDFAQEMSPLL